MTPKLKAAVIGAGRMGSLHSRIYNQMEQVELAAIVDTQVEKAQQLTGEYGGQAYSDFHEIIDLVDLVTIAAPTQSHSHF